MKYKKKKKFYSKKSSLLSWFEDNILHSNAGAPFMPSGFRMGTAKKKNFRHYADAERFKRYLVRKFGRGFYTHRRPDGRFEVWDER